MTRSTALVASGTDWISLVSARISSTCIFLPPTLMPPALLISSRAISAPFQWCSPCTKAIGPSTAILSVPCASAADVSSESMQARIERSMGPPPGCATIDLASKSNERLEMPRDEFMCEHRLRVRWAEVDMQKIVFNGHYLTYIDTAIAEYWRAIGLPYPEGYVERYGQDVFLRKATVEYLGSARYDDVLAVACRVARL